MSRSFPRPADDRAHDAPADPTWVEAWLFDLVQHDLSYALSIELVVWPHRRQAAFHTSVLRPGERLISLVETSIAAPKPPTLEVRAPGLWTEVGIQTPLDHATVDLEAFAVELDEPDDVFTGAYGFRTPLGTELEWETEAEPIPGAEGDSYDIACIVHGELLLGPDTIEIDGWGWRSHRWGQPRPGDRTRCRGRTAAGDWFASRENDRELTMQVLGSAPVPDPTRDAPLHQFLARNDAGDVAWIRHQDQLAR